MSINLDPNNVQNQQIDAGASQLKIEDIQPKNDAVGNVAKPSKLALFGRVVLGILTLGISEGIRAIVHKVSSKAPHQPRIDREPAAHGSLTTLPLAGGTQDEQALIDKHIAKILKQCDKQLRGKLPEEPLKAFDLFKKMFAQFDKHLSNLWSEQLADKKGGFKNFVTTLLDKCPSLQDKLAKHLAFLEAAADNTNFGYACHYQRFAAELFSQVETASKYVIPEDKAVDAVIDNVGFAKNAGQSGNSLALLFMAIGTPIKMACDNDVLEDFTMKLLKQYPNLKTTLTENKETLENISNDTIMNESYKEHVQFANELLTQLEDEFV